MKLVALESFYSKVLTDLGVVDGGEGKLSYSSEGILNPITVDGKRLCLPSRENLKTLNLDHNVIFHPLSEQIVTGPSPILNALRKYITLRLTLNATVISHEIMKLAADPSRQAKLPAKAKTVMLVLAQADEKALKVLDNVLDKVGDTPETRMYNLYLRGRGTKETPNGIRTTAVTFPILDDAESDDMETFNKVKMERKTRDKPMIVGLLKYVLTGHTDTPPNHSIECTTPIPIAPYLNTLLTAFYTVAKWQNEIIALFGKHIPKIRDLSYNLDWEDELNDFENFARKIGSSAPLLPGNEGKSIDEANDAVESNEERLEKVLKWSDIKDEIEEEPVRSRDRDDRDDNRRSNRDTDRYDRGSSRDRDDRNVPNWKRRPEERERNSGLSFGDRDRGRGRGFTIGDDRDRGRDRGRDRDDRRSRGRNW